MTGPGALRSHGLVLMLVASVGGCSGGGSSGGQGGGDGNGGAVTVTITPSTATVAPGGQVQFAAAVTYASDTSVTWSATGGTVSTTGLFTAPAVVGQVQVTATSRFDPTKSATATVTVTAGVAISIAPTVLQYTGGSPSENANTQVCLTATVTGSSDTGVTWGSTEALISDPANSSRPARGCFFLTYLHNGGYPDPAVATITATSVADPSVSVTAQVLINMPVSSFNVYPRRLKLRPGEQWWGLVSVRANHEITERWTARWLDAAGHLVQNATCPGVNPPPAERRAPASDGSYTLRFTSTADPSWSSDIAVEVLAGQGTDVTSDVLSDTTWTPGNSPYYLQANRIVRVAQGVILSLGGGTELHLGAPECSALAPGATKQLELVGGTVLAQGTPQMPVRFLGVQVGSAPVGLPAFDTSRLELSYVEYYKTDPMAGYVRASHTDFFESSPWLTCDTSPCIQNRFLNASVGGAGEISYSLFFRPGLGSSTPVAINGPYGTTAALELTLRHNTFTRPSATYLMERVCDAVSNDWGTTDTSVIDRLILDKHDDPTARCDTLYLPILTQPDPQVPPMP